MSALDDLLLEIRNETQPNANTTERIYQALNGIKDMAESGAIPAKLTIVGVTNGNNKNFTTNEKFLSGSSSLYLNGVRQKNGEDYIERVDGMGFSFLVYAPDNLDDLLMEGIIVI